MSTFNSQSTSSSASSASSKDKYGLSDTDTSNILLYKNHSDPNEAYVKVSTQRDLCQLLDKDVHLKCSTKQIPRGAKVVPVWHLDTFNEPERTMYGDFPNPWVADIQVPRKAYWSRLLKGDFGKLYIVSKINRMEDHKTLLDMNNDMTGRTEAEICTSPVEYEHQ